MRGLFIIGACAVAQCAIAAQPGEIIGKFRNTYYYSVQEKEYAGKPIDDAILDMEDGILARVNSTFHKATNIEGTAKLTDGRVINFAGRKNGETRYHVTMHPFGHGVGDCALTPFHSVAVDDGWVPLGSVVQIEETVGMILPDGSRHDGIWRVEDIGGHIKGDRIDLFVGDGDQGETLAKAHIRNLQALTLRLVSLPQSGSCVEEKTPR